MPDAIGLPIFSDPYARGITACGQLQHANPELLKRLVEIDAKKPVVQHGQGTDAEYVSIFAGGNGGPSHLHFNVSRGRFLGKNLPEPTASDVEIAEILRPFFGSKIKVRIIARYAIPGNVWPQKGFLHKTTVEAKAGDLLVEQTGASFAFGDGPVRGMEWFMANRGEQKEMRVELEISLETTVDSDYLRKINMFSYTAFSSIVLGEEANVARE